MDDALTIRKHSHSRAMTPKEWAEQVIRILQLCKSVFVSYTGNLETFTFSAAQDYYIKPEDRKFMTFSALIQSYGLGQFIGPSDLMYALFLNIEPDTQVIRLLKLGDNEFALTAEGQLFICEASITVVNKKSWFRTRTIFKSVSLGAKRGDPGVLETLFMRQDANPNSLILTILDLTLQIAKLSEYQMDTEQRALIDELFSENGALNEV